MGNSSDGISSMIDFSAVSTVDDAIDLLLTAIPDPDSTSTSGAQQGSAYLGYLDEISPMAAIQLRVELEAMKAAAVAGGSDETASGTYTAIAADATANLKDIVTGLADIAIAESAVSVYRAGVNVTGDAVISEPAAGTIRVADGATFVLTAGDVINWFARSA